MSRQRPFRFGVQSPGISSAAEWPEFARRVESLGYDTLVIPDHIGGRLAYAPALATAALATSTLRVGTLVLDNDFRHPAITAWEAATLDVLSDGRFELGIGAGWMLEDYQKSGIPFDPPGVRVERFAEALDIIKQFISGIAVNVEGEHYRIAELEGFPAPIQKPHPPILIGAGGKRMLSLAAREANIVGLAPPALPQGGIELRIDAGFVDSQVEHLQAKAGERFEDIELQMLIHFLEISNDPLATASRQGSEWGLEPDTLLASPHVLIGSVDSLVETLLARRERFGISYVVVRPPVMEDFAPVIPRLRNQTKADDLYDIASKQETG